MQSKAVSPQTLTYIAEGCAQKLKTLNVSGNSLVGFAAVLNKITVSFDICLNYMYYLSGGKSNLCFSNLQKRRKFIPCSVLASLAQTNQGLMPLEPMERKGS